MKINLDTIFLTYHQPIGPVMVKTPISSDMAFRRAEAAMLEYNQGLVPITLEGSDVLIQVIEMWARRNNLIPTSIHRHNPEHNDLDGIIIAKTHPSREEYFSESSEEVIKSDKRAIDTAKFLGQIMGEGKFIGKEDAIVIECHMAKLNYLARSLEPFGTWYQGKSLFDEKQQRQFTATSFLYHAFDLLVDKDLKVEHGGLDFYKVVTQLFGIGHPDFIDANCETQDEELIDLGRSADYYGSCMGDFAQNHNHTVLIVGPLDLYVMRSEGIENYYGQKNILALEYDQDSN